MSGLEMIIGVLSIFGAVCVGWLAAGIFTDFPEQIGLKVWLIFLLSTMVALIPVVLWLTSLSSRIVVYGA